jgi:tetratricopeptide (TPR) repeat protein
MSQTQSASRSEILILRAGANGEAALVIQEILRDAGVSVRVVEDAADESDDGARTVLLLSQDLAASPDCLARAERLVRDDPDNEHSRLVVLRIEECEPPREIRSIAYVDLVPLLDDESAFPRAVVGAVVPERDLRAAHIAALHRRSGRQILHTGVRSSADFVGRAAELAAIQAALARTGMAVVHGASGTGSSMLARQYAWDNHEGYAGVWWICGVSRASVSASIVSLGGRLIPGLDETPDHPHAALLTLDTISQMQTGKPWLLVYDDVAGPETLASLIPAAGAHVLVTSRAPGWPAAAGPIALDVFARPLAMDYLLTRTRKSDAAAAGRLADDLGRLPLTLAIARATAWAMGLDADAFRSALAGLPSEAAHSGGLPPGLAATLAIALKHAAGRAPRADQLLGILAYLAPDAIPLDVVSADLMAAPERDAAVEALHEVGLVMHDRLDDGSHGVSVHPLVQRIMRDRLGPGSAQYAMTATSAVAAAYPGGTDEHDPTDIRSWSACDRLEEHARAVLGHAPDTGVGASSTIALLERFAHHLEARGDLDEAQQCLLRAIAVGKAVMGDEDVGVAGHLADLARVVRGSDAEQAERLLREAIGICERAGPARAPRLADHLDALANLQHGAGHTDEAETLWRRTVEVAEGLHGPDHAEVARRLGTLAQLLHATNRRSEAEPLMRRALDIAERRLGADHPGTAERLADFALLLRDNGQTTEAEPLLRRALAIDEAAFGPEHPAVAADLGSLSSLLRDLRRPQEALPLARRALGIDTALFEPEHPVIARHYNNIAMILTDMGRPAEVDPYIRHAVLAAEKSLGPNHPETRRYRANYERVLAAVEAMARQDDAVESGRAAPPPERLARQDIPPPTRKGILRRLLQNKRV